MPKHKSVLREQAQQINFKSVLPKQNTFKSVLNCQNTFKSVFNLLGLFVEDTFRRETISTLHTEKLSRNWLLQENMESSKICFLVRPQYCPPFFDASDSSESNKEGEPS